MRGRLATQRDVDDGRAVFVSEGIAQVHEVSLPAPAIVTEEEIGEPTPVIVIQAEELDDEVVAIGYRFLDGGNGICTLAEVAFLREPDERFD